MRSFPFIAAASALAAFSLFTVAGGEAVRAQAPAPPPASASTPAATSASAPLAKPRTWLVENHDRLVTLREKDGPPLFAQVITTADVIIELNADSAKRNLMLILKDANGKRLYQMQLPRMEAEHGDLVIGANYKWSEKTDEKSGTTSPEKTGGLSIGLVPTAEAAGGSTDDKDGNGKIVLVLNEENGPVRGDMTFGKNRTLIERQGMKLTMTQFEDGKQVSQQAVELDKDKQTFTATSDGKEVGSAKLGGENRPLTLRDEKGEVAMRTVKQDGKDYTEFTIGDRKILVEGGNWNFNLKDGVMTLAPSGDNTQTVKTAPITTTANK